jgi:hypothetical protein
VHAHIRRDGLPEPSAATMSAAQLMTALQLARDLQLAAARVAPAVEPAPVAEEPAAAVALDENVTPLASARAKKD